MTGDAERWRVAICDDQEPFRRLLAIVLDLDPELELVGEASDGREAVELCERLRPDVLLLDIAMPVMDGLEALPLIRASAPETQVVMLTGVNATGIRDGALAAGASGFIEKGSSIDELPSRIKELCRAGSR
jgi:DNA-binding NarL/FixJ family response regulator